MELPRDGADRRPPRRSPTLRVTVWSLVTVLVGLVVVSALVTGLARLRIAGGVEELTDHLLPAQAESRALTTAFVDQETGQRGYLLTGDPTFLAPYAAGRRAEADATAGLSGLLGPDPGAQADLAAVTAAAQRWRTEVAEPDIAARRAGPVPPPVLASSVDRGKALFDVLRGRLGVLDDRTDGQARAEIAVVAAAQQAADAVVIGAAVLSLVVAAVAIPLVRRRLIGPLVDLQSQAERTAAGAYDTPIVLAGPRDLTAIGDAVETMRAALLRHGADLADARLEIALRDARDRLAAEVHDNSIQRLFALGLALQVAAHRHRDAADDLAPLVDETDDIVHELRELISGLVRTEVSAATLREQMFDLVRDSGRTLGITPALEIRGPVEDVLTDTVAQELLAVLRECLANIARHARAPSASVRLAVDDEAIALTVSDDGVGVPSDLTPGQGLTLVADRAERLGGAVSVTPRSGGGTRVSWRIPRPQGEEAVEAIGPVSTVP
ncbi:sensor histidine kinase [Actinomycetospora sp. C-140]